MHARVARDRQARDPCLEWHKVGFGVEAMQPGDAGARKDADTTLTNRPPDRGVNWDHRSLLLDYRVSGIGYCNSNHRVLRVERRMSRVEYRVSSAES